MSEVNLFKVLASDAMNKMIEEKGEKETLAVIKRISIKKELRKVYLKAFFQEVHRRET